MAKTHFDLRKYRKFLRSVKGPEMNAVYKKWGRRYLSWIKFLYKANSLGGLEWPPLKSTSYARALGAPLLHSKTGRKRSRGVKARMRKNFDRAKERVKILIDTGTLFKALSPNMPGNLFKLLQDGVRVGFTDTPVHKDSDVTIRKIAMAHQKGNPAKNLPQRKILRIPNETLKRLFLKDLSIGLKRIGSKL
jgi:hypothetical protein